MRCMRLTDSGGKLVLVASETAQPIPGDGEVLVGIKAAGVTPSELSWYPTTHTKLGTPRTGAIPGHEFSGVITAVGANVNDVTVGQEVYGMNDWFADGATAEFCLTRPEWIAPKPLSITHEAASTVPIGALTALQGLFDRAKLQAGETVLVHGGSGAVGLFAVQLAHSHGAHVIATASGRKADFVTELGAERVIDYRTSRFENEISPVDVVFDTVGGDTLDRSWQILKPEGRMVTVAAQSESTTEQRAKNAFFIVEPRKKELEDVARLIDQGSLKTFVSMSVPLSDATAAYLNPNPDTLGVGKVVIVVSNS